MATLAEIPAAQETTPARAAPVIMQLQSAPPSSCEPAMAKSAPWSAPRHARVAEDRRLNKESQTGNLQGGTCGAGKGHSGDEDGKVRRLRCDPFRGGGISNRND